MSAIGPGDMVECILECNDDTPGVMPHWLCGARIDAGRVYTVLRVDTGIDNFGEEQTGFVLVEKDTHWPRGEDGELGGWNAYHFRPLYTRKQSLIESLKQPAPADLVGA